MKTKTLLIGGAVILGGVLLLSPKARQETGDLFTGGYGMGSGTPFYQTSGTEAPQDTLIRNYNLEAPTLPAYEVAEGTSTVNKSGGSSSKKSSSSGRNIISNGKIVSKDTGFAPNTYDAKSGTYTSWSGLGTSTAYKPAGSQSTTLNPIAQAVVNKKAETKMSVAEKPSSLEVSKKYFNKKEGV